MSMKQYLLFLASGTAIAFCAWCIVLIGINPVSAGLYGFLAFYITLFATLSGLFATIATIIRIRRYKQTSVSALMSISLRQGLLLGALFEGALILLALEKLTTLMLVGLLSIVVIIEWIFLSCCDAKPHNK